MDNKARKATAKSQLLTAAGFLIYTAARYGIKGHLNYINVAMAIIFCLIIPAFAIRTLYLLQQEQKQNTGTPGVNPEQLKE